MENKYTYMIYPNNLNTSVKVEINIASLCNLVDHYMYSYVDGKKGYAYKPTFTYRQFKRVLKFICLNAYDEQLDSIGEFISTYYPKYKRLFITYRSRYENKWWNKRRWPMS